MNYTQEELNGLKEIREAQIARREQVKKEQERITAELKSIREAQIARRAALR